MRVLLAVVLMAAPLTVRGLWACSCAGPGTPCLAAGSSDAVFTGKVLAITDPPPVAPFGNSGPGFARRRAGDLERPMPRPLRTVRIRVGEVLSGVDAKQEEIEIVTGQGGGDCGYAFQIGTDYVVYAYKNADGRLETGICSRTRSVAQASEDLQYLRAMSRAPETSEIRVHTGLPGVPAKPGVTIVADREGTRYRALTNAAGDALFTGLPSGVYTLHAEADGDLPDDPQVRLRAKGCQDLILFRFLRITGRILLPGGAPTARVEVQLRSTADVAADGRMTDQDGRFEMRVVRPGQYYLGINLNHTPTRDTPFPRWYHPGTKDAAAATRIDFSGRPEMRTYDLTLPDRQAERTIEGIVLRKGGEPAPRAVVSVFDSSRNVIAQELVGQDGRFALRVFAGTAYRLHAVLPGAQTDETVSAVPVEIVPDGGALSLRLTLTQAGNSIFEEQRSGGRE